MQETQVEALGWEDPLEKETAAHFSILAWRIPWTEEPDRLQLMGLRRSQTRLSIWAHTLSDIYNHSDWLLRKIQNFMKFK